MIDKNAKVPIYYQLEKNIKQQLQEGTLQAHEALPAEREIAEKFGISRMTVRQAFNNLVQEGVLYRQQGKGTFVSAQKLKHVMKDLTSFTEEMRERGLSPGSKFLAFHEMEAPQDIATRMSLTEGEAVYKVRRIRLADDVPMCIETIWIPKNLFPVLTQNDLEQSFYNVVERNGYTISSANQEFEASLATDEENKWLGLSEQNVVMKMRQTSYINEGKAFEYVDSVYRADRYTFVQELSR